MATAKLMLSSGKAFPALHVSLHHPFVCWHLQAHLTATVPVLQVGVVTEGFPSQFGLLVVVAPPGILVLVTKSCLFVAASNTSRLACSTCCPAGGHSVQTSQLEQP